MQEVHEIADLVSGENGLVRINGTIFPRVVVDIGGGNLLSAFFNSRFPGTAVIVNDRDFGASNEVMRLCEEGRFEDIGKALSDRPNYDSFPEEVRRLMGAYFREYWNDAELKHIFFVRSFFEELDSLGFPYASTVLSYYPSPSVMCPKRIAEVAGRILRDNGVFEVITEDHEMYVEASQGAKNLGLKISKRGPLELQKFVSPYDMLFSSKLAMRYHVMAEKTAQ